MTGAHSYTYSHPSALDPTGGRLGLATSGGTALAGPVANPRFFSGFLTRPSLAATGLRAVAQVAAARYFQQNTTTTALRDPVVTCDGDRLRFESFSGCCGVYARLDLLGGALDGQIHDRGTTNVDINEPLRRMLTRVSDGNPLHLAVGPDEVVVSTPGQAEVEKKVPLPERWLRGFAETQVITAGFEPRAELTAAEATRFLRALPTASRASGASWVLSAGRSLRLASRPAAGAVCLAGPQRLAALLPLMPHARRLRLYGPTVTAASQPCPSAWQVDLPDLRFVLVLSPEPRRGLSGEGAVLDALASDEVTADADLVGALLAFEPRVEVDLLAERAGLPAARVRAALTQLGTAGRVGYDLAEAGYFHRELPYAPDAVNQLNPRLRNARELVAAGAVRPVGDLVEVRVADHAYRVRFAADGTATCGCPWWAKYRGSRGKCKHVLAAELLRRAEPTVGGAR